MATFFGEIVESHSRAFWDDEDEFDEIPENCGNDCDLQVHNVGDLIDPVGIKLLIVVHGALTSGFAEACLLEDATLITEIKDETVHKVNDNDIDNGIRKKPIISTKLYKLGSVLLCVCSPDLNIKHAFEFTELMSRWIKISPKVVILTCNFSTSYYSDNDDFPPSFLRELHTDNYKDALFSEKLEQPNVISGIPSGILTWCQVFETPAVLYVVYTDSNILDSISAQPLVHLFTKFPIKLMKNDKPIFKKKYYGGAETSSNLYM